jgi:hypothetical protein
LTIVLTTTAIKDLIEDLKRWKSDENINKQMTEVYDKYVKRYYMIEYFYSIYF